jgi:hypothetical protein
MRSACLPPEKRTWVFFFLILFVALLWAAFLLVRGEMIAVSTALVMIAVFISLFSFIHCKKMRTWIFFYLIVMTAMLWASFLLMKGAMIWVSAFIFLVSGGVSIFAFCFYEAEQ